MDAAVVAEAAGVPVKVAGEEMEKAAPGIAAVAPPPRERNRIQVATNKKPVRFYVSLAKRIMQQHNEVVLSALGKGILTSTVESKDESSGRNIQKAKIEILLGKIDKLNDLKGAAVQVDDGGEEPEEDRKDC
ncbi:hypothetical protein Taro_023208 [Colocasia esculenta]|uniref:DNA/RNA-binding protein Alba-like domain-containing protein n=1 Tax=Colocasia esculenta TaxID=4460 RepID=A0A843VGN6_COLES|nr:hypothetical protein [Colocasia esculenta]